MSSPQARASNPYPKATVLVLENEAHQAGTVHSVTAHSSLIRSHQHPVLVEYKVELTASIPFRDSTLPTRSSDAAFEVSMTTRSDSSQAALYQRPVTLSFAYVRD
jgi:hypothetical protein